MLSLRDGGQEWGLRWGTGEHTQIDKDSQLKVVSEPEEIDKSESKYFLKSLMIVCPTTSRIRNLGHIILAFQFALGAGFLV